MAVLQYIYVYLPFPLALLSKPNSNLDASKYLSERMSHKCGISASTEKGVLLVDKSSLYKACGPHRVDRFPI